jgi:hypothetical protein
MPPRLYDYVLPPIAIPTDDWIHNSDSWLARRRYVALACFNTQGRNQCERTANGMTRWSHAVCRRWSQRVVSRHLLTIVRE